MQDQAYDGTIDPRKVKGIGILWQAYGTTITDDDARARFVLRHGYEPKQIRRTKTMVLVGPIEAK